MKQKFKAITFSYDDGVRQDKKLIEILDKYGLKGTFNLNSLKFGESCPFKFPDKEIQRIMVERSEIKDIYKNHEVAVHTLTHPNLTTLDNSEVYRQVYEDKKNLSQLVGYEVCGMAYPCGGVNNDDRVAEIVKTTGIKFARTITSTHNFDVQTNLFRFNPTVYHREWEKTFELAEKFINLKADRPQIFYIWGHSYELDYEPNYWHDFEELCKMISNKEDIFYGTNSQVLLNKLEK